MFSSSIIYLLAFIAFVLLAFKPVGKAITGMLDEHAAKVKDRIQEAKDLRQQAQETLSKFEAQQRSGNQESQQIVDRAKQEAKILTQQASEALTKDAVQHEKQLANKLSLMEKNATERYKLLIISHSIEATEALLKSNQPAKSDVLSQVEKALKAA